MLRQPCVQLRSKRGFVGELLFESLRDRGGYHIGDAAGRGQLFPAHGAEDQIGEPGDPPFLDRSTVRGRRLRRSGEIAML